MNENAKPYAGIALGSFTVGLSHPPILVAEMSGNHNGSLERALAIVDAAAKAGAHALKIQTYTADTMTINHDGAEFIISGNSPWRGRKLYDLYREAATPWEWHEAIFKRSRELGMEAFSTPFDASAVDFLKSLQTPFYKIASFEAADIPLIRKVAATGKPLLISTGLLTQDELSACVATARSAGCFELVLLKCTSAYPADPADANLNTIPDLRQRFRCEVGLSDHSTGIAVALTAVALGARVIEKHFTLNRAAGGVDSAFSLEPAEFARLAADTSSAFKALGGVHYGALPAEMPALVFRRSVYAVQDILCGEAFTPENTRIIRPGYGLQPKHHEALIGRLAASAIKRGTALTWAMVQGGEP